MKTHLLSVSLLAALPALCPAADGSLTVKAVNKLALSRPNQTIELNGKDLAAAGADLERIHVKDSSGKDLMVQAVDTDFDDHHRPDLIIFQADFAPNETKTFTVSQGAKHTYSKDQFKAYGRLNRE